jgi:hypothetical protein
MRKAIMICLVSIVALPNLVSGQIETRGRASLQLAGFGTFQDGSTSATALAGLSYFATKGIEVGGDVSVSVRNMDAGDGTSETTTNGYVTARARYNFVGQSLFVPYLSLGVGTSLDTSELAPSVVTYNGGLGFKRFLNERVSFNGEVNYTSLHMQSDLIGEAVTSSAVNFLVGIAIYTGN